MTPRPPQPLPKAPRRALGLLALVAVAAWFGAAWQGAAQAQPTSRTVTKTTAEEGVRWQDLKPAQRDALKPLERDWQGIGADQKQKWLQMADRFPSMPAQQRSMIQTRMAEWTKLTPKERGQARLQFQEAKQVAPQDRRAQWEAYQALSAEQKRQLADRATPRAANGNADAARKAAAPGARPERGDRSAGAIGKSNIVPNPSFAAPPKAVAPTVMQAQPGATTTLISKRPAPPPHQQTGLPKIAATSGFVDKSTLLPKRGPQGAATRAAAATEPESPPRR